MVSVALTPLRLTVGRVLSVALTLKKRPVPVVSARPAPAPVAVMLALTLMSRVAVSVSVVLADQDTAALTWMSPGSLPPAAVCSVTLVVPRFVDKVSAPMPDVVCAAPPAATVKSVGSMSQVPVAAAPRLSTRVPRAIATWAAEVSTLPPRPEADDASMRPSSCRLPVFRSP